MNRIYGWTQGSWEWEQEGQREKVKGERIGTGEHLEGDVET